MKPETENLKPARWKLAAGSGWLPILLLLLVAFALRIHNLGAQSLWNDEGNSFVQSLRPFPDILSNAARDIHPPGYYLLLAGWRSLVGTSEFGLRSLSLFASLLTVAFTYSIGARLFSRPAGWIAAAVVAVNTFSIYYAQEARMYALLGLWSAAGMWLIVVHSSRARATSHQPSAKGLSLPFILGLGLVNAAGLYTHYAYPFVMLVQGVVVLGVVSGRWLVASGKQSVQGSELSAFSDQPSASSTDHPRTRLATSHSLLLPFTLANLLALLLFAPLLPTAIRQVTGWPSTGQPIPLQEALTMIGGWFSLGITYGDVNPLAYQVALVVGLLGLVGISITLWQPPRQPLALLPLLWVIIPVGLFLLLGLFRPANLKFLLPSQIGFALCLGAAAASGRLLRPVRGYAWVIIAVLIVVWVSALVISSVPLLYNDPRYQRADYRGIVARITGDARPGDAVVLNAPNQEEVFRYYYQRTAPVYPLPAGLGGDDAATEQAVQQLLVQSQRIFVLFWGEAERDPNRIVERVLDTRTFQAGEDRWYGDVRLAIYTMPEGLGASRSVNAAFGDSLTLVSAQLSDSPFTLTGADKRDVVQVELQWRTDSTLTTPYKVFLQLLRPDGTLAAQRDSEPVNGARPTTTWAVDELVTDRHGLVLPTDLSAGTYTLIVGLYDAYSGVRLSVGAGNYLELGPIEVQRPG